MRASTHFIGLVFLADTEFTEYFYFQINGLEECFFW